MVRSKKAGAPICSSVCLRGRAPTKSEQARGETEGAVLKEMFQRDLSRVVYQSVFFGRYRSVFLGIYHTDTGGKFGRYNSVSKRGQLPPFSLKRG